MGTTTVRISAEIFEDHIFGYAAKPVQIVAIALDDDARRFDVTIKGDDVPDVAHSRTLCTVQQNRAGQRFITMIFEPLKPLV